MRKTSVLAVIVFTSLLACPFQDQPPVPAASPLTLEGGDYYFSCEGMQTFVYGRNSTGPVRDNHYSIIGWEQASGGKLMRIHLTHGFGIGMNSLGQVDAAWLAAWDAVFDRAAQAGISIIPVFGVWADWNNDGQEWSNWPNNPLNSANGGPGTAPIELLQNTQTRALWLGWVTQLVGRWQARWNIAAWEVFSELNLISGSTEGESRAFLETAAAAVKSADPSRRPVTASLGGNPNWTVFEQSPALEIVQIHPYTANLDIALLSQVPAKRDLLHKPVLIGESGLSAANPESPAGALTRDPNAPIGVRHAVWAGIVSGAMNGRCLWWEDAYALYHATLGFAFIESYQRIEEYAARFVAGVDFTGFAPVAATLSAGIRGG